MLEYGEEKKALTFPHFPMPFQAVIWRNWGIVPRGNIAQALHTDIAALDKQAALLGLTVDDSQCEKWLKKGYQTIIRQNWHLVTYEQLLLLLNWSAEQLAFILKEDDFLWVKLGNLKPRVEPSYLIPLTEAQEKETREIARFFAEQETLPPRKEAPFDFITKLRPHGKPANQAPGLRMVYAYSAPYGDPFLMEPCDVISENQVALYAESGINALYFPAILYMLVPWLGEKEGFSQNWELRLENMRRMCRYLGKYHIKLMLYFNEPRSMPNEYFSRHEALRGIKSGTSDIYAFCTSNPRILEMLRNGFQRLFSEVPELGGFFCITMSENLTHCWSKSLTTPCPCPKCSQRSPADIILEVVQAMSEGAHQGNPAAEVYVWNWGWYMVPGLDEETIPRLPKDVKLLSVSETNLPTFVQGIEGKVYDYSISKPGPGPIATRSWKLARENGIPIAAKIQVNNTWEFSAAPFIPVPGLIEEHLTKLRQCGVTDFMLSWTLGGYPGGNLRLLTKSKEQLAQEDFGDAAPQILEVWKLFDEAFRHFPFNMTATVYHAPQNFGPVNLLFDKPTNYKATMVGFPYDDLDKWRSIYPEEVFESEFRAISELWHQGLTLLSSLRIAPECQQAYQELLNVSRAFYAHFRSSYLQIRYVRLRHTSRTDELRAIIQEEMAIAWQMVALVQQDSRIGFEASNHYYYTEQTLKEKMLNCRQLLKKLPPEKA